jgi:hypothetical protein
MRRRALRPSFVVTFALGAVAIAGGCGSKDSGSGGNGDGSVGCPAKEPAPNTPCDPPPAPTFCYYPNGTCNGVPLSDTAECVFGPGPAGSARTWIVGQSPCNPPAPVNEAGPDVLDGGADGEGQDGGHD